MLAAVLATDRPDRLYAGLSVLVSAAAEGRATSALASFGSLPLLLLAPADLALRVDRATMPGLGRRGQERLSRSLAELRATADQLPALRLLACSAAVDVHELDPEQVGRRLAGISSTPAFLRDTAGAELIFV